VTISLKENRRRALVEKWTRTAKQKTTGNIKVKKEKNRQTKNK
jgi:hypothetical protein